MQSSVRVVARIRPLLPSEHQKDTIVTSATSASSPSQTAKIIRIPHPRNAAEAYSFHFNAVYDEQSTQQKLFEDEVAPLVKHLYGGLDICLFAYGVTGTGKTFTMRGGKSLADRGVIPRLLSAIYRRGRKVEKESAGAKKIAVTLSYYEIYCDKVFDLFEPLEKRTPAGLPIRDHNGKTVVCGLTEEPCSTLSEFETIYDQANKNRSTGATKLNAHSSRSHAILRVKVSQIEGDKVITSTASAIDLAGSEDNRRTENGKERLVESSAINKSLFTLAQCVEAISKKSPRIPYRESKMTRILALGQNSGMTLMILNLAPVRSYHLDTLSSLTFANRTKKIEIREVENEPVFMGKQQEKPRARAGPLAHRQPLRPITSAINTDIKAANTTSTVRDRPVKAFSVYSEKTTAPSRPSYGQKRPSEENLPLTSRHTKQISTSGRYSGAAPPTKPADNEKISRADLESIVNRLVTEKLAERTLDTAPPPPAPVSADVQRRLEALEQRVQEQTNEQDDDERSEGLQYLLMGKQHQVRGEWASALRMFEHAKPFFEGNEKLMARCEWLREKLGGASGRREGVEGAVIPRPMAQRMGTAPAVLTQRGGGVQPRRLDRVTGQEARQDKQGRRTLAEAPQQEDADSEDDDSELANHDSANDDEDYHDLSTMPSDNEDDAHDSDAHHDSDSSFRFKPKKPKSSVAENKARPGRKQKPPKASFSMYTSTAQEGDGASTLLAPLASHSPRTATLLRIVNSRDIERIKSLKGVGAKKAEGIVGWLADTEDGVIDSLDMLAALKGVGVKGVERMREGVSVVGVEAREEGGDFGRDGNGCAGYGGGKVMAGRMGVLA